ncbi:MAG: oxygen-independent coproporphyrinogen III oxidase [Gammaproteobacteria bacterium]|nr:oxygen-independent coproporphyrinogen III oxidase [Gammaproteobacteria bacterium]
MLQTMTFDKGLIRRYDIKAPRYTSYPTAREFTVAFGEQDYREAMRVSNGDPIPRPLSLYIHIPFCASPCFYCGCLRVITRDCNKAADYLSRLVKEIEMQAALVDPDREVQQVHLGGGTPTFLDDAQLEQLLETLRKHFKMAPSDRLECSLEIDPRTVDGRRLERLVAMGFNRISLGVQDFDPAVQEAINRVQPEALTHDLLDTGQRLGLSSMNVDLIYGLPRQTLEGFGRTLDKIVEARPSRIALYSYAHLPDVFKAQKQIAKHHLVSGEQKLALLELAIGKLKKAGYLFIGMDHFALPDDELVKAQQNDELHRNFQGYSTQSECEMIGLGISAISNLGAAFSQNSKSLDEYYAAIDAGRLPIARGVKLSRDDRIRADVIQRIMCDGIVSFADIDAHWGIRFEEYFADSLLRLTPLLRDGLAILNRRRLVVTGKGRLLLRVIALPFDAYHGKLIDDSQSFSDVI